MRNLAFVLQDFSIVEFQERVKFFCLVSHCHGNVTASLTIGVV